LPFKAGLVDIVKASITGTIISNFTSSHGAFHAFGRSALQEQEFKPIVARNGSSMTLAVTAIVLPRW